MRFGSGQRKDNYGVSINIPFKPLAAAALLSAFAESAEAMTEIGRHANSGALGDTPSDPLSDQINDVAERSNASQFNYKVPAIYKGGYDESLLPGIAAFGARARLPNEGTPRQRSQPSAPRPPREI